MEKVEKTSADTQRENELIDQWTMLQWERMAVVQPKAGSGIPGAPANWQLRPGLEGRVPVVFLDLNNDEEDEGEGLFSDVTTVTGELFGEKPETMMRLPILQRDEYQVCVCLSVHLSVRLSVCLSLCLFIIICVHVCVIHLTLQSTISAVASWDSTIHDTTSLNKVTGGNDRVYAILKVRCRIAE